MTQTNRLLLPLRSAAMRRCSISAAILVSTILFAILPTPVVAQADSFQSWLQVLREEALQKGIRQQTVDAALADLAPLQRVIEADRKQPEFVQTFWAYLDARVSDQRIARARKLLEQHKDLLEHVQAKYGVQPRFLVSFWGLETNFGDFTGKIPLVAALATLAYDGRRSNFFREQLFTALELMDKGDISVTAEGSWAGALGQPQFIPTNYKAYAVDFDGDGKRDLWNSLPDIFASAANFLSRIGWDGSKTWGREVTLPAGFNLELASLKQQKPLHEWKALGVRGTEDQDLPDLDVEASLLLPAGHGGPVFLVYNNFRKTLGWNASIFYAIAVGHLADRIAGIGPIRASRPKNEERLSHEQVIEIQELLIAKGHDLGVADGVVGPMTRDAIKSFQKSVMLPPDGYPTIDLLNNLQNANSKGNQ